MAFIQIPDVPASQCLSHGVELSLILTSQLDLCLFNWLSCAMTCTKHGTKTAVFHNGPAHVSFLGANIQVLSVGLQGVLTCFMDVNCSSAN